MDGRETAFVSHAGFDEFGRLRLEVGAGVRLFESGDLLEESGGDAGTEAARREEA